MSVLHVYTLSSHMQICAFLTAKFQICTELMSSLKTSYLPLPATQTLAMASSV